MGREQLTSYKRWGPIVVGLSMGAIIGQIYGDIIQFALYGYFGGIIVGFLWAGQTPVPSDAGEKRIRQRIKLIASASVIVGAVFYGCIEGKLVSGLGLGIGLVIVVGLSWGVMYDERMAEVYNKATRNAFIIISIGMATVGFLPSLFETGMPLLWGLLGEDKLLSILWFSWGVFGVSLLYYNYLSVE